MTAPKAIQELARHTSLGVTQRYMHLCPDHRREAIELLDARPFGHQLGTNSGSLLGSTGDSDRLRRKRTGIEPSFDRSAQTAVGRGLANKAPMNSSGWIVLVRAVRRQVEPSLTQPFPGVVATAWQRNSVAIL
jgi:hypothetical protein